MDDHHNNRNDTCDTHPCGDQATLVAEASRPTRPHALPVWALAALGSAALTACGGGTGTGSSPSGEDSSSLVEPTVDKASGAAMATDLPGSYGLRPVDTSPRPTYVDAVRFLTQATFGVKSTDEIAALIIGGYEDWLWRQFHASALVHVSFLDRMKALLAADYAYDEWSYQAIWQEWLFGHGQLRARVAFALSEIFVISNIAPDIPSSYAMSSYWDVLNRNAFGNYRSLLDEVTKHPAMGYYLNLLGSQKEDPDTGTHPNENYAREVLQLFSIGLVQLKSDGSTRLDANGKPLPSYDEDTVKGFAKAFSGWSFGGSNTEFRDQTGDDADWIVPMRAFADYHSPGTKKLLNGVVLAAGGSPEQDMKAALDNIFQHPNVGPFICRQLIQRLVTSNPTPQYIADVAAVFDNNGSQVRGDLKAVVRAILLHSEARRADALSVPGYGKLREPVIRLANFLRAVGANSSSGIAGVSYVESPDDAMGQGPLMAPSVFNFFSPNFRPSGPLQTVGAPSGLTAPEFQVTNETSIVGSLNFLNGLINDRSLQGYNCADNTALTWDYASLLALADQPSALVERLNLLFFCAQMSNTTRTNLLTLVQSMLSDNPDDKLSLVQSALTLCIASPDHVVQK